jgi:hypothetical protein
MGFVMQTDFVEVTSWVENPERRNKNPTRRTVRCSKTKNKRSVVDNNTKILQNQIKLKLQTDIAEVTIWEDPGATQYSTRNYCIVCTPTKTNPLQKEGKYIIYGFCYAN